jgi:hypothetical protein
MQKDQNSTKTSSPAPPAKWTEGEARKAMGALQEALRAAEITLPTVEIARGQGGPGFTSPLVDLGRARPDVIEDLAEIIRRGVLSRG